MISERNLRLVPQWFMNSVINNIFLKLLKWIKMEDLESFQRQKHQRMFVYRFALYLIFFWKNCMKLMIFQFNL